MKKFIFVMLSMACFSGQMPYKKNPEVAVTKEAAPVQEQESAAPKEEKRVGAAKKVLQTPNVTQADQRGAAQKVREDVQHSAFRVQRS